ncbi:hypothetical protein PENTCL1PPCAC_4550, partial [Pristionchus entomophagus]
EEDYKIDNLFYRICYFCFVLGVNFYQNRCSKARCVSLIVVTVNCCINLYFVGYIGYLCINQKFESNRVATSIAMGTWVLQATLSTIFLAFWQSRNDTGQVIELLYEANKGAGIHHSRRCLVAIVRSFYFAIALTVLFKVGLMIAYQLDLKVGFMDEELPMVFGDRRLFLIVQLSCTYCMLCWTVALFIFSLLVHSTYFEFRYFNEQVRSIKCNYENKTDESLCCYLLELMKTHTRLTECVKSLDKMFNRYAFVMIATIIPVTIFSLFMITHRPDRSCVMQILLSCPLVFFCLFTFFTLVDPPSQLHDTIYSTKSALCANTHIWFPYRPNVYHSALAFACHLDQTNLGVSIWGFAVVSKPLVLTTLSVMVTCLATFLQLGD